MKFHLVQASVSPAAQFRRLLTKAVIVVIEVPAFQIGFNTHPLHVDRHERGVFALKCKLWTADLCIWISKLISQQSCQRCIVLHSIYVLVVFNRNFLCIYFWWSFFFSMLDDFFFKLIASLPFTPCASAVCIQLPWGHHGCGSCASR